MIDINLKKRNPAIYKEFMDIVEKLEKHYKDMQDMEFTVEEGNCISCKQEMVKELQMLHLE